MQIEIRRTDSELRIHSFDNVKDVKEGICGALAIVLEGETILYPMSNQIYIKLISDKED